MGVTFRVRDLDFIAAPHGVPLKAAPARGRSDESLVAAGDGGDASPVRTLVFRGWREGSTLELFTDARSTKVEDLAGEPRAELCWLLPKARCQFRLRGVALKLAPETQQEREQAHWMQLRPEGRALWGWPAPGQPLEATAPPRHP